MFVTHTEPAAHVIGTLRLFGIAAAPARPATIPTAGVAAAVVLMLCCYRFHVREKPSSSAQAPLEIGTACRR